MIRRNVASITILILVAVGAFVHFLLPPLLSPLNEEEQTSPSRIIREQDMPSILRRAEAGDTDAMKQLVDHYGDPGQRNSDEFDLVFGNDNNSRQARLWAERAISSGDQTYPEIFLNAYMNGAEDVELSPPTRRDRGFRAFQYFMMLDARKQSAYAESMRRMISALRSLDQQPRQ